MPLTLQDLAVTAAAAGAAAVFLYRLIGSRRRRGAGPSCPSCPSCASPPVKAGEATVQHLTVVKPSRRT